MALTPKQRRFIKEYAIDANATQAAIRAGYSAKTANEQGARLLANASVAAAIAAGETKHLDKLEITAERVLEELARIAFVSAEELYNPDGSVKLVSEMSAAARAAITQLSVLKKNVTAGDGQMDTVLSVRLADKLKALELLAKRLGLVKEHVEVTGLDELVERLTRARKRVE